MKLHNLFKKPQENGVVEVVVDFLEGDSIKDLEIVVEKTEDTSKEKHVPYIEEHENGYVVKIGELTKHPMTSEHYIQFIELIIDDKYLHRKYLSPGEEPIACFEVPKGTKVIAREYCNLHGLWINKK